jgi:hypothetical protein
VEKQEDNIVWRGSQDMGEELAIQFDEVSSLYKWCYSRHVYTSVCLFSRLPVPVSSFDLDLSYVPYSPRLYTTRGHSYVFRYSLPTRTAHLIVVVGLLWKSESLQTSMTFHKGKNCVHEHHVSFPAQYFFGSSYRALTIAIYPTTNHQLT